MMAVRVKMAIYVFPTPTFSCSDYRCLHSGHPESSHCSSAPPNLFVQGFRARLLTGNGIIAMNTLPVDLYTCATSELVDLDTAGSGSSHTVRFFPVLCDDGHTCLPSFGPVQVIRTKLSEGQKQHHYPMHRQHCRRCSDTKSDSALRTSIRHNDR